MVSAEVLIRCTISVKYSVFNAQLFIHIASVNGGIFLPRINP